MSKVEKGFWLAVAGYGLYSAGTAFSRQLNKVDNQGANIANVLVLAGLGVLFLTRLESTSNQAKAFFAS